MGRISTAFDRRSRVRTTGRQNGTSGVSVGDDWAGNQEGMRLDADGWSDEHPWEDLTQYKDERYVVL